LKAENAESQFQHHIPRFYLRGWSTIAGLKPKRIWIYEKGKSPRHAAVKETGGRENMYAVVKSDGTLDIETVEKYLARIESRAGKIFPKIFRHEPLLVIEKEILSIFISVMYRRDTYTVDAFAPQKLAPMIPVLHAEMRGQANLISDDSLRKKYLLAVDKAIQGAGQNISSLTAQAILNSERLGRAAFNRLNWCFIYTTKSKFLTSDSPVVFDRFGGIRNFEHGHVLFPVSSDILLWMTQWPIHPNLYAEVPDTIVDVLNKAIVRNAFNEVYSGFESEDIRDYVDQHLGDGLPDK
jgi:hypothetical protein